MCGLFAEGGKLVCTHKPMYVCTHTHEFSTQAVFQMDWRKSKVKVEIPIPQISGTDIWLIHGLIPYVLLKVTFFIEITNTALSSMCANTSPDLSCNLWELCWSLINQQCCPLIAGGSLESSGQRSPWRCQEGQGPPPNGSFSVDLEPYW